ncbi:glutathione synthetase, ATP-grasp domain [Evansella caseinilytica]|uniref:Glutathione synthetase, ATP-grasp domain n=1 Tax=Evansella caseinilytica TaxID=1503961 RepID=A0A1H3LBN1_9BACI|nr:hypothetical protein [Evansella caseinilytica]SDY61354.1 glutathione synthetase, ATP-grasp domain [Evansella caseinilytica]
MNKKHALIIGDVNSVANYLNYDKFRYSIITSEYEETTIPHSVKELSESIYTIITPSYFDVTCFEVKLDELLSISKEIEHKNGQLDAVIATHEHTVLPAAYIRSNLNVSGLEYEQAKLLRDKHLMKSAVKESVPTLDSIIVNENSSLDEIKSFINKHNKLILKPLNQAGSSGIVYFHSAEKAINHIENNKPSGSFLLEEYVEYIVYHFDGMILDGKLQFVSVSEKVGNCFNFVNKRESLSTILINDKKIISKARDFVKKCLSSMFICSAIFHLEVFRDNNGEFIFLEIAGRYPGSGITNMINQAFNIDLVRLSFELDSNIINKKATYPQQLDNNLAMMKIPTPYKKNLKITGLAGLEEIPCNVIKADILCPGNIFDYSSIDAFKSVATFYIQDNSTQLIKKTIKDIDNNLKFYYKEVL